MLHPRRVKILFTWRRNTTITKTPMPLLYKEALLIFIPKFYRNAAVATKLPRLSSKDFAELLPPVHNYSTEHFHRLTFFASQRFTFLPKRLCHRKRLAQTASFRVENLASALYPQHLPPPLFPFHIFVHSKTHPNLSLSLSIT